MDFYVFSIRFLQAHGNKRGRIDKVIGNDGGFRILDARWQLEYSPRRECNGISVNALTGGGSDYAVYILRSANNNKTILAPRAHGDYFTRGGIYCACSGIAEFERIDSLY